MPGELDVHGYDGDLLGVDGAQVGVLEKPDQERLRSLLEGWRAKMVENCKWGTVLKSWMISLKRRWNKSFLGTTYG